ncbi:SH3 domain-containing protein [Croceicoccus sp. F390]|uniref:SH3 domain-containing protein n=1 Tax=Croceicoccus esteveae TaxID=3075597 RepID=A0ABU2ZFZ2_9SPHN|nr:SH3 domain-containing protein [Croceicoccus sp. F390]MDT0575514.1 SH3 domain-containing protein [Croceicoccus sp. F390]
MNLPIPPARALMARVFAAFAKVRDSAVWISAVPVPAVPVPAARAMAIAAGLAILPAPSPAFAADEVPYWASVRAERANARSGPGRNYKVEWVYQREDLPVKVVRRLSGWRLIEDPDGDRGWIVARFLSEDRTVIVTPGDPTPIRAGPDAAAPLRWKAAPGVVGSLDGCSDGWCAIAIGDYRGYISADRLWGDGDP